MKLEDQVTSLELSKRLKELGVKQESLFYWRKLDNPYPNQNEWYIDTKKGKLHILRKVFSAFTVAELGELLPLYYASFHGIDDDWICNNLVGYNLNLGELCERDVIEVDARARMLIYLLENKLMKV